MIRSTLYALLGLVSVVAVGTLPLACQSGGVGDPCIPEDEYSPQFAGFDTAEANIESRSFQCQTRICLVNHFQGRVSCPLGQDGPMGTGLMSCNGLNDTTTCTKPQSCVQAAVSVPACATDADCNGYGNHCNTNGNFCSCQLDTDCINLSGGTFFCDGNRDHDTYQQCVSYLCHTPLSCQTANGTLAENCSVPLCTKGDTRAACQAVGIAAAGTCPPGMQKDCCAPGTDTPVAAPVCGQCSADSHRDAANAVYCSCRCAVADGDPPEPNFNFCSCPTGYTCTQLVPDVGLGDAELTGKYCIKSGSDYTGPGDCGNVAGATPKASSCFGQSHDPL